MVRSFKLLFPEVLNSKRVWLNESIAIQVHIVLPYGYAALICFDVASRHPSPLKL